MTRVIKLDKYAGGIIHARTSDDVELRPYRYLCREKTERYKSIGDRWIFYRYTYVHIYVPV